MIRIRRSASNSFGKWIGLALVMSLLLACSASSGLLGPTRTPEPTATPALLAKPGHWEGDPEVAFFISADGMVRNFTILVAGDCRVTVNTPVKISAGNTLTLGEIDEEGKPVKNGILGTFDSSTTIEGNVAAAFYCGEGGVVNVYYLPEAMTGWSAEWVGP